MNDRLPLFEFQPAAADDASVAALAARRRSG